MGVSASAVARVIGIETFFKDLRGGAAALLPQQVALIGQGATASTYATTPQTVTSAQQVGALYGFGSPVHLAAKELLPANGDGLGVVPLTVYPLVDDGAGAPSVGNILPGGGPQVGAGTYYVVVNGIRSAPFVIADGTLAADLEGIMVAAINANLDMPVVASDGGSDDVDLTSKWEGTSANDLVVSVEGPANGITFGITQPVGGLTNPDVMAALDQIVDKWETLVVSCFEYDDTTILEAFSTWGEGRWGTLVKKPAVVFTGSSETSANLAVVSDARKTDRVNAYATAFGSVSLPCQIAARAVARVAVKANDNPPVDYGGQKLSGVEPGADSAQETYIQLDAAVQAGVSTNALVDGIVTMLDTVTFYHPDGEDPPAYRYVVDIVKLQNIIFNLDVIFNSPGWDGAPLIPDDQPTTNPAARKPKDAKAAVNAMIDSLGLGAILSDPATAKTLTTAVINAGNPKRLDVTLTVQLSGNTNIISIDLNFGFFFGAAAVL
jgi:phage tail sheath gpL-like